MKSILALMLVLLLTGMASLSAQQHDAKIELRMWGHHNELPDYEELKEKYVDESAVVLYVERCYEYKKPMMLQQVNQGYYFRRRVLLLDKASVEKFSQFSFGEFSSRATSRQGVFMGIKVVKHDGRETIVNLDDKVSITAEVTRGRQSRQVTSHNKIAIPDLQPGDILDYYFVSLNIRRHPIGGLSFEYVFNPEYVFLKDEYPIEEGKVEFFGETSVYLTLKSMNGAPEPKLTVKADNSYYVIEYSNSERFKSRMWTSPMREAPHIKFQVIVSNSIGKSGIKYFVGSQGVPKNSITQNEYHTLIKSLTVSSPIWVELERKATTFTNQVKNYPTGKSLPENLFYFMRNFLHFNRSLYYGSTYTNYLFYDSFDFVRAFSRVLSKNQFPHHILLGVEHHSGTLEDALFMSELTAGIRVNLNNEYVNIFLPEIYSIFGQQDNILEGAVVLSSNVIKSKAMTPGYDTIPKMNFTKNKQLDSISVVISPFSFDTLSIVHSFSAENWMKPFFVSLFPSYCAFGKDELVNIAWLKGLYDTKQLEESIKGELEDNLEHQSENKKWIVEWLKEGYSIGNIEVKNITIENLGRWDHNPYFAGYIDFSTTDLIKKAGEYLILDIGSIFGKNVEIPETERERNEAVYNECPRQYLKHMVIDIPQGYEVSNPDAFKFHLKNQTGGFISSAWQSDNKFYIEVEKYYVNSFEPLENWPDLLAMLDLANEFERQKLVFRILE